jgi:S-DNA-T family DNA segregation ATPase FtsK/SpoIIIE
MLELSLYANSPHSQVQVRKLSTYNQYYNPRKNNRLFETPITENILNPATQKQQKLPLIICIIDEMADLIMQYGKEVEELMARIAQKSRAAGIHLILATQRPDSEVMTGLIKANIPSRIAFSVDSSSNSRIILDQKGAEKLLGKGDMLTKTPQDKELHRLQGYFINEKQIAQFLNKQTV